MSDTSLFTSQRLGFRVFTKSNLKVFSACTLSNIPSENVMKKLGMTKMGEFLHPNLKEYPELEKCAWYESTFIT
jgi:hypothetical protein